MVTSSGIRFSSISRRTKLNSVCEADGKPTSISLKPMFTSSWNISSLRSTLIGSISAWLPSRRSVLSQIGALVSTASGQVRSFRPTGANGRYLEAGCCNMKNVPDKERVEQSATMRTTQGPQKANGPLPEAYGPLKLDRRDARATTFARRGRTAVEPAAGSPCVYPWCRNLTYFKVPGHLPAPFPGAGYPSFLLPRPSSRTHPPVSLCPRPSAVPLFKALTTAARGK